MYVYTETRFQEKIEVAGKNFTGKKVKERKFAEKESRRKNVAEKVKGKKVVRKQKVSGK